MVASQRAAVDELDGVENQGADLENHWINRTIGETTSVKTTGQGVSVYPREWEVGEGLENEKTYLLQREESTLSDNRIYSSPGRRLSGT